MDEDEIKRQCMATATSLIHDDLDGDERTWAGELLLIPGENEAWDVYREQQRGENTEWIRIDVIDPTSFGAAQLIGCYLVELHNRDIETPVLPRAASHTGELLD